MAKRYFLVMIDDDAGQVPGWVLSRAVEIERHAAAATHPEWIGERYYQQVRSDRFQCPEDAEVKSATGALTGAILRRDVI